MSDPTITQPDFAVYLDGNKLQGEEARAILGIRVFQTRSGASAFEIIVSDPELKWQAKPTFTDCKEVKIELGSPGKLKKVFDGEVTAWRTELERSGPTVLVLRGLDRSHRMMRAPKTKTYQNATPLDCVQQIAGNYGLSPKTRAGSPSPVKMFRFQANQSDFEFLRSIADLEGYMFWIDGQELHFERPELSSTDDAEFTFGKDLKTFLPSANFRKPAVSVEVGAWDTTGKAAITGKAKKGDELWTVPGGKPGAEVSKFTSTKTELSLVESQVGTQEHADTVAKAALTRRAMEFLVAEVEVVGNPSVKPGAMVNLKKVGAYSGHYYVTEANHFFDAAGYSCIFYVARDKWGDSSSEKAKSKQEQTQQGGSAAQPPYTPPKPKDGEEKTDYIDFTVQDDQGKALPDLKVKIHLKSGETLTATTDSSGHVRIEEKPQGPYTVEIVGAGAALTYIDIKLEDAAGNPLTGASGSVKLSDGKEVAVMTDVKGEVHLTDVPAGGYTFKLDDEGKQGAAGGDAPAGGAADGGGAAADGGAAPADGASGSEGAGGGGAPDEAAAAGGGAAPVGGAAPAGGASGAGGASARGGAAPGGGAAAGGGSAAAGGGAAPAGGAARGGSAAAGGGAAGGGASGAGASASGGAAPGGSAAAGGSAAPAGGAARGGSATAGGGAAGGGASGAGGASAGGGAAAGGRAAAGGAAAGGGVAGSGAAPAAGGGAAGGGTAARGDAAPAGGGGPASSGGAAAAGGAVPGGGGGATAAGGAAPGGGAPRGGAAAAGGAASSVGGSAPGGRAVAGGGAGPVGGGATGRGPSTGAGPVAASSAPAAPAPPQTPASGGSGGPGAGTIIGVGAGAAAVVGGATAVIKSTGDAAKRGGDIKAGDDSSNIEE